MTNAKRFIQKVVLITFVSMLTIGLALTLGLKKSFALVKIDSVNWSSRGGVLAGNIFEIYFPFIAKPASPPEPTPTPIPGFAEQVVLLTNAERVKKGCPEVTMDERLRLSSQGHSEDMAFNDFFSHTGSDGSSPWDRLKGQGYNYSVAGENIAVGYSSPSSVVNGWMASDGHRANILNCRFVHIGVGYFYLENDTGKENWHYYWTQDFAAP